MAISAKRNARIELTADAGKMAPGLSDAKRQLRAFERDNANAAKQAARDQAKTARDAERASQRHRVSALGIGNSIASKGMGLVTGAASALGIDPVDMVANSVRGVMSFEKELLRLRIAGGSTEQEMMGLRESIDHASAATGENRSLLLAAASGYVKFTGDAKGVVGQLELMGKVMKGTGADAEAVSGVMATLNKNYHLDPSQWQKAWDILIKQGHDGGIEVADLATNLTQVSALYATMVAGGDTLTGLSHVSAIAQVLNNMTHSAELTGTYTKDMLLGFEKSAPKLRSYGINPFTVDSTGKQKIRDSIDLLDEIKKKIPKAHQLEVLHDIFPDIRENNAVEYLMQELDAVKKLVTESENSNQTQEDFGKYAQSSAGQMESAWNQVDLAIAKALSPERIAAFAKAAQTALKFVADTVAMIDFLVNGEKKKEASQRAGGKILAETLNPDASDEEKRWNTGPESERIWNARAMRMASTPQSQWSTQDQYAADRVTGDRSAQQDSARTYLDSQGLVKKSEWNDTWSDHYAPRVAAENAPEARRARLFGRGVDQDDPAQQAAFIKAVADGIKASLADLKVTVKADGSVMGQTIAESPGQRSSNAARK